MLRITENGRTTMLIPYEIGQEYNRRIDLHDRFGGSRQSGMSTCADHPIIFIFTGPNGEQHGYQDRFVEDGRFFYTGEGQVDDMTFTRGNKALRDHTKDKRHALLFEQSSRSNYQYRGEYSYIGYHNETRLDREGNDRKAIVFELAFEPLEVVRDANLNTIQKPPKLPKSLSLKELRILAETGSAKCIEAKTIQTRLYNRCEAVKRYALARADGICECCDIPAPFLNKKNEPYLEVHHMLRVADGGPDSPQGVAAICPTCHRNIHNGADGAKINRQLAKKVSSIECSY